MVDARSTPTQGHDRVVTERAHFFDYRRRRLHRQPRRNPAAGARGPRGRARQLEQIAHEIYLLSKGSIVASGSPQEPIHGSNELLHQFLVSSGVRAMPGAAEKLARGD